MSAATILAVLAVLVAVPVLGYVAWKLGGWADSYSGLDAWVLRSWALSALSLQFIVSVFAAIFVNNEQPHPFLGGEATKLITRGAVLLLVGPALYWLRLSRRRARTGARP